MLYFYYWSHLHTLLYSQHYLTHRWTWYKCYERQKGMSLANLTWRIIIKSYCHSEKWNQNCWLWVFQVSVFKPGDSVLLEGAMLPSAMWVDRGKCHHYWKVRTCRAPVLQEPEDLTISWTHNRFPTQMAIEIIHERQPKGKHSKTWHWLGEGSARTFSISLIPGKEPELKW